MLVSDGLCAHLLSTVNLELACGRDTGEISLCIFGADALNPRVIRRPVTTSSNSVRMVSVVAACICRPLHEIETRSWRQAVGAVPLSGTNSRIRRRRSKQLVACRWAAPRTAGTVGCGQAIGYRRFVSCRAKAASNRRGRGRCRRSCPPGRRRGGGDRPRAVVSGRRPRSVRRRSRRDGGKRSTRPHSRE